MSGVDTNPIEQRAKQIAGFRGGGICGLESTMARGDYELGWLAALSCRDVAFRVVLS